MKKMLITLIITVLAAMSLSACGSSGDQTTTGDQIGENGGYTIENEGTDAELVDNEFEEDLGEDESSYGFERTYELSYLEFYNPDTEEWVASDFIPGAEKYVFHDDLSCEYIYKNYPTYEDMLNDSNYEMVNKTGIYIYVPEENGISMIIDYFPTSASVEDNKIIVEHEYNGNPAVRGTYTETEMA